MVAGGALGVSATSSLVHDVVKDGISASQYTAVAQQAFASWRRRTDQPSIDPHRTSKLRQPVTVTEKVRTHKIACITSPKPHWMEAGAFSDLKNAYRATHKTVNFVALMSQGLP